MLLSAAGNGSFTSLTMVHPIITAAGWIDDDRFSFRIIIMLKTTVKNLKHVPTENKKTLLCCPPTETRGNNNSNSRR